MARPSWTRLLLFAAAAALATARTSAAQTPRYTLDPAASRIWFDANATLGRFQGVAGEMHGWAMVGDAQRLSGSRGEVSIAAASLRTGVALRNQHLRHELETDRYPAITLTVDSTEAERDGRVLLHTHLTVKDQTRAFAVPARVLLSGGSLLVEGDLPTRFTELGMRPPSRMAGMARVRDEFIIHFHAVFSAP